ncbi:hypothetical protein JCM21714_2737 [Gracilibacillus boraciitolerans JCM 21714]|uniref:Uncharacterized protein n=1 Tax=Gracilibacillus boraciitolerans JCM 21714 TaxID=1298598 RepID=W4VKA2_9BACI|nr:hypothetical protein [Gracilibacillus boraciitolerans]GAE93637.1 hypothetical protein JCM21714_2737 [Gracilibacillus boraciitolerans JCM 21714]
MNKKNWKKYLKIFFILIIGAFILYSMYIQLEYRGYIKQERERNYQSLKIISDHGNNLAGRLEEFVHLPTEEDEVESELYNNWRIVNGESRSIHLYLSTISTTHAGDEASDWDLLQFSLFRVDGFISGMTNKFLEDHSYPRSAQENEKMEAIISLYRTISEEIEKDTIDIESLLQAIKEDMLIIDDNYSGILERMGR